MNETALFQEFLRWILLRKKIVGLRLFKSWTWHKEFPKNTSFFISYIFISLLIERKQLPQPCEHYILVWAIESPKSKSAHKATDKSRFYSANETQHLINTQNLLNLAEFHIREPLKDIPMWTATKQGLLDEDKSISLESLWTPLWICWWWSESRRTVSSTTSMFVVRVRFDVAIVLFSTLYTLLPIA